MPNASPSVSRRTLLGAAGLAAPFLGRRTRAAETFRIGYQKNGIQVVAQQRQLAEAKLKPLGISVTWTEFAFCPPLLEALRLGKRRFRLGRRHAADLCAGREIRLRLCRGTALRVLE